ncbi:glycerophosphodiester phosphodiesterase [Sutcliffiella rhizosphaerae]|uniref:Glycerophosphodiester phosphodiesterase n=1 Tax=Sutcliffiella rhizosphaerae TaxID=2880967 RepID=A0ABM8YT43_9BACI|nr:glycerophosphodiester phosphodiesterase [Sutcliffiella rhizosphaerae]CAG9623190.1 Glycerophosphodiester phosphodiesterase [Sutcliffiella rhizosphaerae]
MTKIFGHRGSAGTHPENTMISFQQAFCDGADGIELDVQLSKDGIPVVIHDEKVDRTTDGKGLVKDFTLKELKQLNAVYKFKKLYSHAEIPTLEEVLDWAARKQTLVNIELKNSIIPYSGMEEKVLELILKYDVENLVIFSSFNHFSIARLHTLSPSIEKAVLYMEGINKPWDYTKWVGAQGIHPYIKAATPTIIQRSKENGVPVRPFTVNDEKTMLRLFKAECAGFFTDYPKRAVLIKQ